MASQQNTNGKSDVRAIRAGFGIFLTSMSVVIVTLIAARYLTAGGAVGTWSQWLGAITTLFMLISGFLARAGRTAILARGDNQTMQSRIRLSFWFGVLTVASIFLQWVLLAHQGVPITAPTAEVYYILTGIWMLLALVSGFGLIASAIRGRRIGGYTEADNWNVEGSTYFWHFTVVAWLVLYVVLYFL
ncbi:MAG: hypothetical protein M1272_06330 [Firmicutes bacterium]|nr:hypothetical protein [Bacillota bacterium]